MPALQPAPCQRQQPCHCAAAPRQAAPAALPACPHLQLQLPARLLPRCLAWAGVSWLLLGRHRSPLPLRRSCQHPVPAAQSGPLGQAHLQRGALRCPRTDAQQWHHCCLCRWPQAQHCCVRVPSCCAWQAAAAQPRLLTGASQSRRRSLRLHDLQSSELVSVPWVLPSRLGLHRRRRQAASCGCACVCALQEVAGGVTITGHLAGMVLPMRPCCSSIRQGALSRRLFRSRHGCPQPCHRSTQERERSAQLCSRHGAV